MKPCNQDFQMLAVLSGSEQLTRTEEASLAAHAASCPHCQQTIAEMSSLAPHLTLATHRRPQVPRGHEARFIARATREGIPLRAPARTHPTYALQLAMLTVLLVCAASWSWIKTSSIESASQEQKGPQPEPAMAVKAEPPPAHPHAHLVRRPKPAALHTPLMLSSSFRFAWPQTTGMERQPVFTRDLRHENILVAKPTFVSQDITFNHLNQPSSFPFKVDMASLILQEPPRIHLGDVAISDLTFIPQISSHP
jgi:hypothetical protein